MAWHALDICGGLILGRESTFAQWDHYVLGGAVFPTLL